LEFFREKKKGGEKDLPEGGGVVGRQRLTGKSPVHFGGANKKWHDTKVGCWKMGGDRILALAGGGSEK